MTRSPGSAVSCSRSSISKRPPSLVIATVTPRRPDRGRLAAQEMPPDQLSQAQRLAREWKSVTHGDLMTTLRVQRGDAVFKDVQGTYLLIGEGAAEQRHLIIQPNVIDTESNGAAAAIPGERLVNAVANVR